MPWDHGQEDWTIWHPIALFVVCLSPVWIVGLIWLILWVIP